MDAAQEAFIKVYRSIDGFHNDCSFYTWLYRIVVNVCIDIVRRKTRRRTTAYDETFHRPDEVEEDVPLTANTSDMVPGVQREREDLHKALNAALASLTEKHRQVIVLREIEGLSYEEIAEVCDCQLGTVMSRLHHARKKLQVALEPYLKGAGEIDLVALAGQGVRRSS